MPEVAIIGTRGYPSYYGGFETAVRKLAPYLVDRGWGVTVYGRSTLVQGDSEHDTRVISRITPGIDSQKLSTLSYGLTSSVDAAHRRPDAALIMNVANGFFLPLLKGRGIPTIVNVDGIEWERAKWSPLARRIFRKGAEYTAEKATQLVFDSQEIAKYWWQNFGASGTFIPYGGDIPSSMPVPFELEHRGYVLLVARFVPENSVPEFFDAVPAIASHFPVVIVGSTGYHGDLDQRAQSLAAQHPLVSWLGHVKDDSLLLALWQHAGVYFHGHSVGGTNPAMVQAMAAGAPILARDSVFNREVLGPGAKLVDADPSEIASSILALMDSSAELEAMSNENAARAASHYSWESVCSSYDQALRSIINVN